MTLPKSPSGNAGLPTNRQWTWQMWWSTTAYRERERETERERERQRDRERDRDRDRQTDRQTDRAHIALRRPVDCNGGEINRLVYQLPLLTSLYGQFTDGE